MWFNKIDCVKICDLFTILLEMSDFDFHIRKSNQRGLILLLFAAILLQGVYLYRKERQEIHIEELPAEYLEALEQKEILRRRMELDERKFLFDPNRLSYYGMLKLGMRDSSAWAVVKFREGRAVISDFEHFCELAGLDSIERKVWSSVFRLSNKLKQDKKAVASLDEKVELRLFRFNPNTLDSIGFVNLGFSPKQTAVILKYRTKGKFHSPDDFKDLYVVDDDRFELLKSYIQIDKKEKEVQKLDVNTCTLEQLKSLESIGDVLGKRIILERERLHGFVSASQLKEVYGIDSLRWMNVKGALVVNGEQKAWVKVNTMSPGDLSSHPYISYRLAQEIVSFRENFRWFKNAKELQKLEYFPEGVKGKYLLSYISTEN